MTALGPAGRPVRRLPATTAIQLTLTVLVGQALRQNLTTRKQLETSTWTLSLERLRTDAPAAVQLLQLAAFLAPEPIPLRLFRAHADLLPDPLRTAAADPYDLDDLVGLIVGYSLLRREGDRIRLHRLVQAAIRYRLAPADQQREQERVLTVLLAAHPGDPDDPATSDGYAELAPHLLATSPLADVRPDGRRLVLELSTCTGRRQPGRLH